MLRSFCAGVLILVFTSQALAQTPTRPSLGSRIKSWFTFRKPAEKVQAIPKMPPPTKMDFSRNIITRPAPKADPVQVTTRSGVLRKAGPGGISELSPQRTPTFAQTEQSLTPREPRLINPDSAKPVPSNSMLAPRRPLRDTAVTPATYEYEATEPKQTVVGWFKGLWKRDREIPPPRMKTKRPNPSLQSLKMDSSLESSTSIDPRRVYRGARDLNPSRNSARNFSETGVPQSTTNFRGRKDSEF